MRTFNVRFDDGLLLVLDAIDEGDARRTAEELHPACEIASVEEAA